jgi:amino acid adenylation domain-containing protein
LYIDIGDIGTLDISIAYTTDLLSSSQASNMTSFFGHVLSRIIVGGGTPLGALNLLSASHHSSIHKWNSSPATTVKRCLHEMVEEVVKTQPGAPAIESTEMCLSYAELDHLASKLACHLIRLGVGPDSLVPHCFEKSGMAIVAMLATLKAGGACVALNPEHPKARMETIIRDCAFRVVIVSEANKRHFHDLVENIVILDKEFQENIEITEATLLNSPCHVNPNYWNPAFIVFTSGSTGVPKGVVLEHSAICGSLQAQGRAYNIGPRSRVLQFSSYSFDIHLFDIFATLMFGGCLCVPSDDEKMDNLSGVMARLQCNTACLTPTVATMIDPHEVSDLQHLLLAGEAVTRQCVDIWSSVPGLRLTNCYGPSESSVMCSWTDIVPGKGAPSNIGRALGVKLWVVNPMDYNQLLPIGCEGELLIEGPALARGYLNSPKETARAFIENPSWIVDGDVSSVFKPKRVYRTGDLVRYNSDGTLIRLYRPSGCTGQSSWTTG